MPKEARTKAEAELKKLKLMSPMSAEATVVRNYIDTIVALPWKKKTKVSSDLANAEKEFQTFTTRIFSFDPKTYSFKLLENHKLFQEFI